MVQNRSTRDTSIARKAAKRALYGQSPRKVGQEKTLEALTLIYRWGWSTPTIIDRYVNFGRRGLSARLVKNGLTKKERTEAYGGIKDMPLYIITLTEAGVNEVEASLSELNPYEPFFFKNQLMHDLRVQDITLDNLRTYDDDNWIMSGYKTPRELAKQSEAGKKQPDSSWEFMHTNGTDFMDVAIELELSAKNGRELDRTIFSIIKALENKQYDLFFIFSPSQAILERYRKALTPGARLQIWKKNNARHWVEGNKIDIKQEWSDKIQFEKL